MQSEEAGGTNPCREERQGKESKAGNRLMVVARTALHGSGDMRRLKGNPNCELAWRGLLEHEPQQPSAVVRQGVRSQRRETSCQIRST